MKWILSLLIAVLVGCNNNDDEIMREIAANEEMELKVQQVLTQLQNDCDSNLLLTARMIADSVRNSKVPEAPNKSRPGKTRPSEK